MRLALKPHPDTPCEAISSLEVEVWRTESGGIVTRHRALGAIADLKLPQWIGFGRADDLWKHTCFEAFVRGDAAAYYEFNYSPSGQWAAYRFTGYREAMQVADEITPQVEMAYGGDFYELRAYIAPDQLSRFSQAGSWRLGLSAVIEETNGVKSYWALAHPPGKPDFHHADGFAADLLTADQV